MKHTFKKLTHVMLVYFLFLLPVILWSIYNKYVVLIPFSVGQSLWPTASALFSLFEGVDPLVFLFFMETIPIALLLVITYLVIIRLIMIRKSEAHSALVFALLTLALIGFIPPLTSGNSQFMDANFQQIERFRSRFSIVRGTEMLRCSLVSTDKGMDWSYPSANATDVSIYSPVVIRFNKRVERVDSCSVFDGTGAHAGSKHQMLGSDRNGNYVVLPPGALGIDEFQYLQKISLSDMDSYISNGAWASGTQHTVQCVLHINGCNKQVNFSFKTGTDSMVKTPTIRRDIPTFKLDPQVIAPPRNENTYEIMYPTPGMYPGPVHLELTPPSDVPVYHIQPSDGQIEGLNVEMQENTP